MAASSSDPMIETDNGRLRGKREGASNAFLGIPYAAPPIGALRWRAPQPATPWKGERDAQNYAADSAQKPFPPDAAPLRTDPSEDCLYLNVWQPRDAKPGDALPVMVWIHGGGFVNGGTSPAVYNGQGFARDGIVFVSMNYRLGRFGFFAHPALVHEGFGGNFGLLDQIQALKWVRKNIASFGGNPNRVTVFGESAGGMSVHALLQAPSARGLVHQAIIQSGGGRPRGRGFASLAKAADIGQQFAPDRDADGLRALSTDAVIGDLNLMTMNDPTFAGPFNDGVTILGEVLEAIEAGLYPRVPLIVGANSADGFPFVNDRNQLFGAFGEAEAEARRIYDPTGDGTMLKLATATSADAAMIEPARAIASRLADRQPVWLYRFDYALPEWRDAVGGAPHATEIPYVFDTVGVRQGMDMPEPRPDEESLVAELSHRYWVDFAKTGRPDAEDSPAWPTFDPDVGDIQIIDASGATNTPDPIQARLDFVERNAASEAS